MPRKREREYMQRFNRLPEYEQDTQLLIALRWLGGLLHKKAIQAARGNVQVIKKPVRRIRR